MAVLGVGSVSTLLIRLGIMGLRHPALSLEGFPGVCDFLAGGDLHVRTEQMFTDERI